MAVPEDTPNGLKKSETNGVKDINGANGKSHGKDDAEPKMTAEMLDALLMKIAKFVNVFEAE